MSEMLIYLDGELVPREAAKVSVFDHGLLYGDGVFEGIRVYNRRIFRLDAHLDRLYDSARALALAIPLARAELAEAVRTTVRANRREDGYIRLIVTRGALLELAAEAGIAARETRLTRFDLYTAEECFLSGTGAEVIAVTQVDGRPIGGGDPGPVTRRLQQAFQAMARNEGEPLW